MFAPVNTLNNNNNTQPHTDLHTRSTPGCQIVLLSDYHVKEPAIENSVKFLSCKTSHCRRHGAARGSKQAEVPTSGRKKTKPPALQSNERCAPGGSWPKRGSRAVSWPQTDEEWFWPKLLLLANLEGGHTMTSFRRTPSALLPPKVRWSPRRLNRNAIHPPSRLGLSEPQPAMSSHQADSDLCAVSMQRPGLSHMSSATPTWADVLHA